jgi:Asp-tRNA(Asn)/Glu-tRNA(Gln) amidotransferase A subunit family amidase
MLFWRDMHRARPRVGCGVSPNDRGRSRSAICSAPHGGETFAPEVKAAMENAVNLFASLGHTVEEYDMKTDLEAAWWRYNDIIAAETSTEFSGTLFGSVVGRCVHVRAQHLGPTRDVRSAGYG